MISVEWGEVADKKYSTTILIKTINRDNILLDIVSKASNNSVNVESINTYKGEDNIVFELTVLVGNIDILDKFMNAVSSINGCMTVERSLMWEYLYKEV